MWQQIMWAPVALELLCAHLSYRLSAETDKDCLRIRCRRMKRKGAPTLQESCDAASVMWRCTATVKAPQERFDRALCGLKCVSATWGPAPSVLLSHFSPIFTSSAVFLSHNLTLSHTHTVTLSIWYVLNATDVSLPPSPFLPMSIYNSEHHQPSLAPQQDDAYRPRCSTPRLCMLK